MYHYILLLIGSNILLFPSVFVNFLEILVITILIPFINWYNCNKYIIQITYNNSQMNTKDESDEETIKNTDEEDKDEDEADEDEADEDEADEDEDEADEEEEDAEEKADKENSEETDEKKSEFKKSFPKVNSCNSVCDCTLAESEPTNTKIPIKYCDIKCSNYVDCECKKNILSNQELPPSPELNANSKVPFYVEYELD